MLSVSEVGTTSCQKRASALTVRDEERSPSTVGAGEDRRTCPKATPETSEMVRELSCEENASDQSIAKTIGSDSGTRLMSRLRSMAEAATTPAPSRLASSATRRAATALPPNHHRPRSGGVRAGWGGWERGGGSALALQ